MNEHVPSDGMPTDEVASPATAGDAADAADSSTAGPAGAARKRRRGSRGGQRRRKPAGAAAATDGGSDAVGDPDELPDPIREGRPTDVAAAERALVRKPQIGDTRPAPP
ncbi:MAG: hypothetical protein MUE78_07375, partial [Ilumatobacteraceae bacterium]|nr:hypothetical protein [Ilumatobacteraceae bacterium]